MKISKLNIEQYKHLENLVFDFTYQTGKRKGEPLDKICFIGQSATGKTNLLELINKEIYRINTAVVNQFDFSDELPEEILLCEIYFKYGKDKIILSDKKLNYNDKIFNLSYSGTFGNLIDSEHKKTNYFFKSNLISENNIDLFTKNPLDIFEKYHDLSVNKLLNGMMTNRSFPVIFDDKVDSKLWIYILSEILEYRKKFNQKMSELIHKGLLANTNKLSSEFKKWQKENPNKLEEFALKFNPIIEKLNLEVDIVNTEYSIPISNKKNDEIIPIQNTSTGTKGLLLTFLPLFKLDTKDAIILMDEPERSLYPDMQMDLIEHYQSLAPDAQFIVATHSPFIAASFEPEERFILYFDEEGKVAVRRGSSPIGDDPNDMLKNDFGVNYYNKHGEDAYKKYIRLKQATANEKDPKKKKELLLETVKLGDAYNF
jgi:AAA15 family ATPase/GTPase